MIDTSREIGDAYSGRPENFRSVRDQARKVKLHSPNDRLVIVFHSPDRNPQNWTACPPFREKSLPSGPAGHFSESDLRETGIRIVNSSTFITIG
jgi:hypothetical protein